MRQPEMIVPESLQGAVRALQAPGAVALAGATDLIPAMRRGEARPRSLVNLKQIPGLSGIRRVRAGVRIGATTLVAELLESQLLADSFPVLVEVAHEFGSPLIRNLATVGGNLCNAAPSADLALPLLALDARAEIRGRRGARMLDLCEFFRGVNRTVLRRGEVLAAVIVPRPRARTGVAHAKLTVRQAMDLAVVGVAASLTLSPGGRVCRRVRLALGAVAPVPMRAREAEALLEGNAAGADLIEEAAAAAAAAARPVSDLRASRAYRREMIQVLARRVLREALRRAGGKQAG